MPGLLRAAARGGERTRGQPRHRLPPVPTMGRRDHRRTRRRHPVWSDTKRGSTPASSSMPTAFVSFGREHRRRSVHLIDGVDACGTSTYNVPPHRQHDEQHRPQREHHHEHRHGAGGDGWHNVEIRDRRTRRRRPAVTSTGWTAVSSGARLHVRRRDRLANGTPTSTPPATCCRTTGQHQPLPHERGCLPYT